MYNTLRNIKRENKFQQYEELRKDNSSKALKVRGQQSVEVRMPGDTFADTHPQSWSRDRGSNTNDEL